METSVTTLEELLPQVRDLTTAREFGAAVIRLVPAELRCEDGTGRSLRRQLALAARDALSRPWGDNAVRYWSSPKSHTAEEACKRREERRRWKRKRWAEYKRKRRARDPAFRIQHALRTRVRDVLQGGKKSAPTLELLGCSIEALKSHIEGQFAGGMGWHNYGAWHLDHVRPCASFDLTDPEQQRACFHHTNLQPLWAADNIGKGSLYDGKRYERAGPQRNLADLPGELEVAGISR